MRSVIIVHDSYSSNIEPWIVSVSDELKVRGLSAYVPKFPTPIGQDYISWKVLFDGYAQYLQPDTILVGSGVGCAFLLRYMSESPSVSVAKTVFIAPFATPLSNPSEQLLAQTFLLPAFDVTLLKPRLGKVEVVISDNDLLVESDISKAVANMFGARILTLPGKGHFRAVNGVRLLPEVVDLISEVVDVAPVADQTVSMGFQAETLPVTPVTQPIMSSAPSTPAGATATPVQVAAMPIQTTTTPAAASPSMATLAAQVSATTTTDVVALQKLLAELSAKGVAIPAAATQSTQPVTMPEPMNVAAPAPDDIAAHSKPVVVGEVEPVVIGETTAKPAMVTHSLVSDFSSSLINADAKDVSKTLSDYRAGKEYSAQEKTMKIFRAVAAIIGVILLLGSGYFAYRVYFFNETLPAIRDLDIPPLNAVSVVPARIDRSATPAQSIKNIVEAIDTLDLSNVRDIGVLKFSDQDDNKVPAELAIRLIGGTTPSSIYTKLGSFYTVGAVKDLVGTSPFAVFALGKPEPEVRPELATWEEWMARDLLGLFAAKSGVSAETHDLAFEDRTIANRDVRVLVARRKSAPDPILPPAPIELAQPVIKSNGVPDTTTPVLPLGNSITTDADSIAASASVKPANSAAAPVSTLPSTPKREKNIIDLFKISSFEQTAIKRTKNTLIIASNSPIFQKGILPGDLFALESSDKEEQEPVVGDIETSVADTNVAPILGGAPTIVQITDIIQQGAKTELAFKTLELSEAIALAGQEVFSNVLPNGASVLAPVEEVLETGPIDVFAYSVVNGKVLIFSGDIENIPLLAEKYFEQKKSIFDMWN